MNRYFLLCMLLGLCLSRAYAVDLETKSYTIYIKDNCEEGSVTCDKVSFLAVNKRTGEKTELTGETMHRTCKDGVTPCRFLGYQFSDHDMNYIVHVDGRFEISKNGKVILSEMGKSTTKSFLTSSSLLVLFTCIVT